MIFSWLGSWATETSEPVIVRAWPLWRCKSCEVGWAAPEPGGDCWSCATCADVIPGHQFRTPTSSAYLRSTTNA